MLTSKMEQKGGLVLFSLPSAVHRVDLRNRYPVCSAWSFAIKRGRGTVVVNVAAHQQPGLGTRRVSLGCLSSTLASATLCNQGLGARDP